MGLLDKLKNSIFGTKDWVVVREDDGDVYAIPQSRVIDSDEVLSEPLRCGRARALAKDVEFNDRWSVQ